MSKRKWTDEELILKCKISKNKADLLRKLGVLTTTGYYRLIDKHIKRLNIDISHFEVGKSCLANSPKTKKLLEEILVENSSYNTSQLRHRLVKENIKKEICEICGISSWNDKKIILQIDHINGINSDHRIENLRLICPNCHSQTETYCKGIRKKKEIFCIDCGIKIQIQSKRCRICSDKNRTNKYNKIIWPNTDTLKNMVDELGYVGTGKKLGVSNSAVKKRLNKLIKT